MGWSANSKKNQGNCQDIQRPHAWTSYIDAMTIGISLKSVRENSSLNRTMCIRFESRKICVAGNKCDNNDFDFHNAEHKELPLIKISSDEGR